MNLSSFNRRIPTGLAAIGLLTLSLLLLSPLKPLIILALFSSALAGFAVCILLLNKRKQAALPLKKLFETTLNEMREGVLIIDHDMRVVASNSVVRGVFAYADDTIDFKPLTQVTSNNAICSAFLEALRGRERAGVQVEVYGPPQRIYDLRVTPMKLGEGEEERGAVGIFFDVTRLERLERVRQEFLSNVSHELRTPLTSIRAFVETLEDGAIEDTLNNRRFVAIIGKHALRMQSLLDDILELSAIEAGTVAVEPTILPLRPIVDEVFLSVANKAEKRGITLHNKVTDGVMIYADDKRLEQMLTNLVDNAVKFNRDGGQVTVSHENGTWDEIHVTDTGEGIASQHLERLFERFYRVDKARSREMGGTGLGLAIVKHLARAHGGEVTVKSKLNKGTIFTIRLPGNSIGVR
jgi:two-component system phosphate regulon sensor histidine kinase PhoR